MLAPLMNGIAVVLRSSGRRMRSGAATAPPCSPPTIRPRCDSPHRNRGLLLQAPPTIDQLFVSALIQAGYCRRHTRVFHSRAGSETSSVKSKSPATRLVSHSATRRQQPECGNSEMPVIPWLPVVAPRDNLSTVLGPVTRIPPLPPAPPQITKDGDEEQYEDTPMYNDQEYTKIESIIKQPKRTKPVPQQPKFMRNGKEYNPAEEAGDDAAQIRVRKVLSQKAVPQPPKLMRDGKESDTAEGTGDDSVQSGVQKVLLHESDLQASKSMMGEEEYSPAVKTGDNSEQIIVRRFLSPTVPYDHRANWKVSEKVTPSPASEDAEMDVRSYLPKVFPDHKWGEAHLWREDPTEDDQPEKPPKILRYVYGGEEFTLAKEIDSAYEKNPLHWPHFTSASIDVVKFHSFRTSLRSSTLAKRWRRTATRTEAQYQAVMLYTKAVDSALLTHQQLFSLYMDLPDPRMTYLDLKTIDRTLGFFMSVTIRDEKALLRYTRIINDVVDCSLHLTRPEWNQAMAVFARAYRTITPQEVSTVIKLWTQSEAAGVPASIETFNILLNAASRSDDDLLFRRILDEIARRKLRWSRFTHVIQITHYGTLQRPESVSAAYQALVDAGEIVDVVVLNAVISAMIACGEIKAAIKVYDMMRQLTENDPQPVFSPPFNSFLAWISTRRAPRKRELERNHQKKLMKMAAAKAVGDEEGFQKYALITKANLKPDITTYNIFISYYCGLGQWSGMRRVVAQMNHDGMPANEATYEALLRGFQWHGQPHYTNTAASAAEKSPSTLSSPPSHHAVNHRHHGELENWNRINLDLLLEELFSRRDGSVEWRCSLVRKVVLAVSRLFKDTLTLSYYWDVANERLQEQGGCADEALLKLYKDVRREVRKYGSGGAGAGGGGKRKAEGQVGKRWRVDDERERLRDMFGML